MNKILLIKVVLLAAILGGVIYVMTHMNADAMARALAAFGVEAGTPESPGLMAAGRAVGEGEERMSICPNRVQSLDFVNGAHRISETTEGKRNWIYQKLHQTPETTPIELPYMEVEKWFSLHCQIVVKWLGDGSFDTLSSAEPLTITYIDGSKRTFTRLFGQSEFSDGQRRFESKDFSDALDDLKRIAQFE